MSCWYLGSGAEVRTLESTSERDTCCGCKNVIHYSMSFCLAIAGAPLGPRCAFPVLLTLADVIFSPGVGRSDGRGGLDTNESWEGSNTDAQTSGPTPTSSYLLNGSVWQDPPGTHPPQSH